MVTPGASLSASRRSQLGGTSAVVSLWIAVLCAPTYALAVSSGIPLLRHDWDVSPFLLDWRVAVTAAYSSWLAPGIGSPVAYPNTYVVSIPIVLLTAIAGGQAELLAYLVGVGALVAFGARAVALDFKCTAAGTSAAMLFALFNPWTYTELVAGHVFMLLAYAASIWLVRELLAAKPRTTVLCLAAIGTLQQIQFFLISTTLLALIAVAKRQWRPLALVAIFWLPILVGLFLENPSLQRIPLTIDWERSQSIIPADAVQLNGYFAHYAEGFRSFFATAVLGTFTIALVALRCRAWRVPAVALGTLIALLCAMGTRGPLAAPFAWGIEHVRATALFRELFDVLGYAAIGYLILATVACGRWRWGGWIWLCMAMLLPVVWITSPPDQFWVSAQTVPRVSVPLIPNTRFALTPVFQPMSYGERSSGLDPDAYARASNVTPLNAYLPAYPVDAALGAFALHASVDSLEALSVSSVTERPWLRMQNRALEMQWALPFAGFPETSRERTLMLDAAPELALLPLPQVGTLDANVGSGNIFFGDAALVRGTMAPAEWGRFTPIRPIAVPSDSVRASEGWVEARLAFAERPDLAQAFGGALTTNRTAELQLRPGIPALVFIEGTLRAADGAVLTSTTHGYRWIPIPVARVTCVGLCVVAAQGNPPVAPLNPPKLRARGVRFTQFAPWLAVARLPAGSTGALRYNVAYDDRWMAYLGGRKLTHMRLDGSINGWFVPRRTGVMSLVLIEVTAALQLLAELLAVGVLLTTALIWLLRRRRRRRRAPR